MRRVARLGWHWLSNGHDGQPLLGTLTQLRAAAVSAELRHHPQSVGAATTASPGPDSSSSWGRALPWAAASVLLLPILSQADSNSATDDNASSNASTNSSWLSLLGLNSKRRIFFKYEKRIRDNSSLEKVFDYFSSHERDGLKYMTPLDLLAAIVPTYPPSQSQQERSGSLDGEPRPHEVVHEQLRRASETIFQKFDVDGDGVLSFWEYRLVLTLLAIPEADVEVIFNVVDADGSGSVDVHEFREVVASLQGQGPWAKHHGNWGAANRLGHAHTAHKDTPSGLLVSFFGQDQTGKLELREFMSFLEQLHYDMTELEFAHYDVKDRGAIPGVDFARALVAVEDVRQVDALMDKVDALSSALSNAQISKQDFRSVLGLSRKGHNLGVALNFYVQVGRPVTREELDKLLRRLNNLELSSETLDVLMAVFADGDGHLDVHLFTQMLARRSMIWTMRGAPNVDATASPMAQLWDCIRACGGNA